MEIFIDNAQMLENMTVQSFQGMPLDKVRSMIERFKAQYEKFNSIKANAPVNIIMVNATALKARSLE